MADFYCENVLSGAIQVEKVYESKLVLAFHHTSPYFETHVVVIPKQHIASLLSAEAAQPELAGELLRAVQFVASAVTAEHGGCRVASNVGSYQSTPHLHFYVHAGRRLRNEDGSEVAADQEVNRNTQRFAPIDYGRSSPPAHTGPSARPPLPAGPRCRAPLDSTAET